MRKFFTFVLLAALMCGYKLNGQIQPIGNKEFGRIFDLTYDQYVQNKVYGITLENHIVISNDNGINWSIFYSLPFSEGKRISKLKTVENGTAVSFVVKDTLSDHVVILNLATKIITKSFYLPNIQNDPWVNSYDFYKGNTDILLVDTNWKVGFTTFGKTFITYNHGNTWSEIYSTVANNNVFVNKVAINPTDENKLYLLRDLGDLGVIGGLWTSSNSGNTWQESLAGIPLSAIEFDPVNVSNMYLGTGISFGQSPQNLYKSTNGGTIWQTLPITWSNTGYLKNISQIRINPYNPQHIIALEEDEVVLSFDGGLTWQNHLYPYDNIDSYYYGLNTTFNPFNSQQVLVTSNYKPIISSNGGITFDAQIKNPYFSTTGNVGTFRKNSIDNLYYSVQKGWIYRNNVNNQEENHNISPLNNASNGPLLKMFADKSVAGRLYIYDGNLMDSVVQMSDQHGLNPQVLWHVNFDGTLNAIYTNPINTNIIWAAFNETIGNGSVINNLKKIKISNNNNIIVDPINLPTTEIISKVIFPSNTNYNEVIISAGNKIYKTVDGGQQWTILGLTQIQDNINDITQNPLNPTEFAIATEGGIYISTDLGINWILKSSDKTDKIFYSEIDNGNLVAVALTSEYSNFSVYYSANSGNDWTKVNDNDLGYLMSSTTDVVFENNKANLYIGSADLGIVQYTLNFGNLGTSHSVIPKGDLYIYPNPVSDILNIKTSRTIAQVNIWDASGRLLITSYKNLLNVSMLKTGTYFLKVDFKDGTQENRKFIKK